MRKVLPKIIVLLFLPQIAMSQDSVLYMWNEIVNDSEMDEVSLLEIAQISTIELRLMRLHVNTCQEFQPELEKDANLLVAHINDIERGVSEFLNRYTNEEIDSLGARIGDSYQELYEMQLDSITEDFSTMGEEDQLNVCSQIRTEIFDMERSTTATIEKGI